MSRDELVLHATDVTFEKLVLENDLPVLVDFWAPWCGPCRAIAPTIEELASEYVGSVLFVKVDVDEARSTARGLQITSIPTVVLFNRGKSMARQIGAQAKTTLRTMIDETLAATRESARLAKDAPDRVAKLRD